MKAQAPKGTRDFYPAPMALRNYLTDAWRRVSIRHGFEQVDGPIFESLDLYKVKSGEGIVSELFHFEDRGGRELAIRPEFTPTLARMVAAQANTLPKPIKWFCTPNLCRAERPQRGRLREFFQWNCDALGTASPIADAECILVMVDLLRELGLSPTDVYVKISHRQAVRVVLATIGVADDMMDTAFELLDRRDKLEADAFTKQAAALGLEPTQINQFDKASRETVAIGDWRRVLDAVGQPDDTASQQDALSELDALARALEAFGISDWCKFDLGIVRGLAYYTGTVFEVHEASGAERAIAGGGRYDHLIELFGGPPTPAVGFGMGDVVLANILEDRGLIPDPLTTGPDVFVIALTDLGANQLPAVVAELRSRSLHTRFSYKQTRNLGKLLKEATTQRAHLAVLLGDEAAQGLATVKDLNQGTQTEVPLETLADHLLAPANAG